MKLQPRHKAVALGAVNNALGALFEVGRAIRHDQPFDVADLVRAAERLKAAAEVLNEDGARPALREVRAPLRLVSSK